MRRGIDQVVECEVSHLLFKDKKNKKLEKLKNEEGDRPGRRVSGEPLTFLKTTN